MLRLLRRHVKSCKHRSTRYRRCACPIHVYGTLGGEKVRKALDQTSWEAATALIAAWTESGEIGVVRADVPSIADAVEKFLADLRVQNLAAETIRKYSNLLERRLLPWCEEKGYRQLKQLSVEPIRMFRHPGEPLVPVVRFIDGYQSRNERLADLMRRMGVCEEKSSGIDRVVQAAELYQLPAPDFSSGFRRTSVTIYGPRPFDEMDRNDRVRACYQHCALKWVMAQRMTNQSLRAVPAS